MRLPFFVLFALGCRDATDPCATAVFFGDGDGDGFGGPLMLAACVAPDGFGSVGGDCDDGDALVFPGAPERCNGVADACGDVPVDEADLDADGVSACAGDCDDGDPSVSPLASEMAADAVDGDCDGGEWCWGDADGDGVGAAIVVSPDLACDGADEAAVGGDCDDLDPALGPGPEVPYDGLDNDCDPGTRDDDVDGDGFLVSEECDDDDPTSNPDLPPDVVFTDVTAAAGLWAVQWDAVAAPALCAAEPMAAGAAIGDADGDGDLDLFVTRIALPDLLYFNDGAGGFTEAAVASGIDHVGTSSAAAWLDLEGDGDQDLYVVSLGMEGNRLYVNAGDGTFAEEAAARGADVAWTGPLCSHLFGVSVVDIDGDGDPDLHLDQWKVGAGAIGDRARLLVNDGTGTFVDGTLASGLDLFDRAAFSSSFGDVDGDGDLDLALAADWATSGLWRNDAGVFTEITAAAGVGTDENGMGSDLADFDQDGDLDWFVTAIYDPRAPCDAAWGCTGNRLYVNDGTGTFVDGTDAAGLRDGGWGWGAAFFDYDNDGDLDLGMTNGFPDPWFESDRIRLFDHDGAGVFRDVACATGLDLPGQGRAFLPFDVDDDGDLDVFTTLNGAEPRLYRNDGGDDRSWLRVRPSEPGNPTGLGAVVRVQAVAAGPVQRRDVHGNTNFAGQRPPEVHVGLGTHEAALFEVRVTWPDGAESVLSGVSPRQVLTVDR